jgi:hypothetical protein
VTTIGRVARTLERARAGTRRTVATPASRRSSRPPDTPPRYRHEPPAPRARATACASPSRNPAAWPSRRARCSVLRPELAREPRPLFCYGESLPVDLLLVRDDDIPG